MAVAGLVFLPLLAIAAPQTGIWAALATLVTYAAGVAVGDLLAQAGRRRRVLMNGPINHVGMFTSAHPKCWDCSGSGWYYDFPERCLSRCPCVADHDEVTGNA